MTAMMSVRVSSLPRWVLGLDAAAPDEDAGPATGVLDPDAELVAAAAHDPDAFAALYDRYYDAILNMLHRRTRSRELAEDLTATAFTTAWRELQRGRMPTFFRPWLYRVALNAWLTHARRQTLWNTVSRFLGYSEPVVSPPQAAVRAEQRDLADAARRELMRLPARYREPLILRIDDECDYADIAAILSLTPSGARTRVARGLKILRQRLQLDPAREEPVP